MVYRVLRILYHSMIISVNMTHGPKEVPPWIYTNKSACWIFPMNNNRLIKNAHSCLAAAISEVCIPHK